MYDSKWRRWQGSALGLGVVAFGTLSLGSRAHAEEGPPPELSAPVENPPLLPIRRATAPRLNSIGAVPGSRDIAREAAFDLEVKYRDGWLWNPAAARFDKVRLRSYLGTDVDEKSPFVAPLIEIQPGETVRVTLKNELPADPSCAGGSPTNTPHCFNGTNLHTHGLWVNPAGNSDNVLISIDPGVEFQYEYNIPPDHPAGTFWYHTHRHGSTALQVASGMAGALIIRGDRPPQPETHGDLDTLLKNADGTPIRERILVFQQIPYACRNAQGSIKQVCVDKQTGHEKFDDACNGNDVRNVAWICDKTDVGTVEGMNGGPSGYDQFGPGSWQQSGRYTTINGHVLPLFIGARAGALERWRMVHGGVRDTIALEYRKLKKGAPRFDRLKQREADAYIGQNCTGAPVPFHVVAADGLTTARAMRRAQVVFQPGYRWDTLMVFPEEGDYCVIDAAAPVAGTINRAAPSRQLLGMVRVDKGSRPEDVSSYLRAALVAAAKREMPANVQAAVIRDLNDGLKLTSFVPHADITDAEVAAAKAAQRFQPQSLTFYIDVTSTPTKFEVGTNDTDMQPYDPARIDRRLMLGAVGEWTLRSDFVSHPFHIHVNPFQIVEILDPMGRDVSGEAEVPGADPQYRGLKGLWKDTLWVESMITNPADKGNPKMQYKIVVRTRYERYIGDFVLHCHILDHEDQGMMQNVRIELPNGLGGMSQGHH